jgi:putative heme-binding domain-containing protein
VNDPSPDVRVQVAVAAGRLSKPDPLPVLLAMMTHEANAKDPLIPNILYNNLKPFAPARGGRDILAFIDANPVAQTAFADTTARWIRDAVNATGRQPREIVSDLDKVLGGTGAEINPQRVRQSLQSVIDGLDAVGVRRGDRVDLFDQDLRQKIRALTAEGSPARVTATVMALWWNDRAAVGAARQILADPKASAADRARILKELAERRDPADLDSVAALVGDNNVPIRIRQQAVDLLATSGDAGAARSLIDRYASMNTELKPAVLNALARTPASAAVLLDAVAGKKIPQSDVNANHVRQIQSFGDAALTKRVADVWGIVKTERDPERVKIVEQFRQVVKNGTGDPVAGWKVFEAKCGQCHTIYGKGGQVGPDLTGVGRETLDAVLTNVIDPNLVIGKPYYVNVARTKKGIVFSGILVEETPTRVVLRDGTKTETIARDDLDRLVVQNISMMPEGLEKTMSEQEIRDLVAFLLTKEPPKDGPLPAAGGAGK